MGVGDLFPKKFFIVWDNKNCMLIFEVLLIVLFFSQQQGMHRIIK